MKKYSILLLAFSLYFPAKSQQFKNSAGLNFTENKGQVHDQNYKPRPDVLFSGNSNGLFFHLKNNGISYQLNKIDSWREEKDQKTNQKYKIPDQTIIYRLDINWLGINSNFTTKAEKAQEGYNNYYLEVCPNGVTNVKTYEDVYYNSIYKNINLHYYNHNGTLKYDYIVAPKGDYKQIRLQIEGAQNINLQKDGSVLLSTPLGSIQEDAPLVYQNGKQLKAKWVVAKNILSFDIENYDTSMELIIDPAIRIWGTFYGGEENDLGHHCTLDKVGNSFITGATGSSSLIATAGSHQDTVQGQLDLFLAKFDANGVRAFGTYYGGTDTETDAHCCLDRFGNIYLSGFSNSFPCSSIATPGSFMSTSTGGDVFLVKFNSNGVRLWGTYYGGTGNEDGTSCNVDTLGNVYLMGQTTTTTSSSIATPGCHQAFNAGSQDGFLVKFNSNGARLWGTYFGGEGNEWCFGASCIDLNGNVFVAGTTTSADSNSIATATGHQSNLGGYNDAFLIKFNSNGVRQWGTYYGSTGWENGSGCSTDQFGNVYLAGTSDCIIGTAIATPGSHQSTFGGPLPLGWDAFLVKFDSNGARLWGTYYGGNGHEDYSSCNTDNNGNVYLVGTTSSNAGTVFASAGSHQTAFGGGNDAFLAKFNSTGVRQWGTYYGGMGDDRGISCALNGTDKSVYLLGTMLVNSGTVMVTAGSYQSFWGGNWDAFYVKFKDCSFGSTINTATSVCAGNNIILNSSVTSTVTSYNWNGPNGFVSNAANPVINNAASMNSGTYTLTVNDGGGCFESAIATLTVISCVGLEENLMNDQIIVYPNPTKGFVTISSNKVNKISFTDVWGRILLTETIREGNTQINLNEFQKGIYILSVEGERSRKYKIIKE